MAYHFRRLTAEQRAELEKPKVHLWKLDTFGNKMPICHSISLKKPILTDFKGAVTCRKCAGMK